MYCIAALQSMQLIHAAEKGCPAIQVEMTVDHAKSRDRDDPFPALSEDRFHRGFGRVDRAGVPSHPGFDLRRRGTGEREQPSEENTGAKRPLARHQALLASTAAPCGPPLAQPSAASSRYARPNRKSRRSPVAGQTWARQRMHTPGICTDARRRKCDLTRIHFESKRRSGNAALEPSWRRSGTSLVSTCGREGTSSRR